MKPQHPNCRYCHRPIEDRLLGVGGSGKPFAHFACSEDSSRRLARRFGTFYVPSPPPALAGQCAVCGRDLYTQGGEDWFLPRCPKNRDGKLYCSEACRARLRVIRRRKTAPERACRVCGSPFQAKRTDAKFCSPKCRQTAHRAGQDYPPADLSDRQQQALAAEQERQERERREILQKLAEVSKAMGRGRI